MKSKLSYIANLIFPALVFSAVSGSVTGAVVVFYKFLAGHVISFSETAYSFFNKNFWVFPLIVIFLFNFAIIYSKAYKKYPNLQGGGIPTSVGILRGLFHFKWLVNVVGTFFLSLISFLVGVPLGNEGPAVQMGTAIGKGSVNVFAKKHRAWERYSMTGGACAGFSAATGANLSGIVFAIEEAHGRISPMIILVAVASVMFSNIVSRLLCPIFKVNPSLFPKIDASILTLDRIWLPIAVGVVLGLFAVVFIKFYKLINKFFNKTLAKIPQIYKILAVLVLTFVFGSFFEGFISTGHHLTLNLFENRIGIVMLLLLILVRTSLTLSANSAGITGGIFLPLLSLGALVSALVFELGSALGMDSSYYTYILALGIIGAIAGMMKMPFTAILFAVEVLGFENNILFAAAAALVSFAVTEIFSEKSINDYVLEAKLEEQNRAKERKTREIEVEVKEGAFAVGKEVRDIFWPNGAFVLSVNHTISPQTKKHSFGAGAISEGDKLHIRYTTCDEQTLLSELNAIVG